MTARNAATEPWWHEYADGGPRPGPGRRWHGVGMTAGADQPFGTLSAGERRRVSIARALMPDPDLLLLDEPAASLDLAARETLLADLTALAAEPRPAGDRPRLAPPRGDPAGLRPRPGAARRPGRGGRADRRRPDRPDPVAGVRVAARRRAARADGRSARRLDARASRPATCRHATVTRNRHAAARDRAPTVARAADRRRRRRRRRPRRSPSSSPACCPARTSLVAAVGQVVIDNQPPGAKDFVVALFGTNDKLALEIVIVLVALAIGAGLGVLAARRSDGRAARRSARSGSLGFLAALGDPAASPAIVAASAAAARSGSASGSWAGSWPARDRDRARRPRTMPDWSRRSFLSGPVPSGSLRSSRGSAAGPSLEREPGAGRRRRPAAARDRAGADPRRRTTCRPPSRA